MNQERKEYTLIDADQDYFANDVTGASWTISINATPNGEAYKVAILNNSATDHSGKTATIVGLDADGKDQSEVLSLPAGSATVYSAKYYSLVTTVTPSATIGADTMDIGTSGFFASKTFVLTTDKTASIGFDLVSGTINYTAQCTYNNNSDTPYIWQNLSKSGQEFFEDTVSDNAFLLSPPNAIRFITNSFSSTPNFFITVINNFARG
jgi:hypothetical protein